MAGPTYPGSDHGPPSEAHRPSTDLQPIICSATTLCRICVHQNGCVLGGGGGGEEPQRWGRLAGWFKAFRCVS